MMSLAEIESDIDFHQLPEEEEDLFELKSPVIESTESGSWNEHHPLLSAGEIIMLTSQWNINDLAPYCNHASHS